jgi:hypothetical protein
MSLADLAGRDTCSVTDAARVLGIGRNQAYEGCARGDIPSIRIGGRVIVPVAGLRRLIEGAAEGDGGGSARGTQGRPGV